VSFYNDEAYGVRVIHSNLIEKNIEAYMLFFKIDDYRNNSKNDNSKNNFISDIDNVSWNEIDILVSHIKESEYDVVGFSLVSQHFGLYKKIFKKINNIKKLTIVIGGWQASLVPEKCIDYADFVCIGEGEEPFYELVDKLETNEPTKDIENFHINTTSGVIKNSIRPLQKDLSSFPIPLFDHKYSYVIENNKIENHEPYFKNNRYGTFVGRGCPYHCTYCSNSFMANSIYPKQWSKIRYRSIDHLKSELLTVKEQLKRIKSINFYDEVFTPKTEWVKDFFSWYKAEIGIPFYMFFFPGTCSDEKARILANGGLNGIWIGVQSGSERVRNVIFKRKYSNDKIIKQANMFHKYGVNIRYDFILDNPFETFEESLESIYLMLELPQPFSLNLFSLKYFPNTEITKMAKDAGFITERETDDNQERDRDTYTIHRERGSLGNRFINHLAFYISCISSTAISKVKKNEIYNSIDNYRKYKDISPIEKMVKPFLS